MSNEGGPEGVTERSLLDKNFSMVVGTGKSDQEEICDSSETLLLSINCLRDCWSSGSSTRALTSTGVFMDSGMALCILSSILLADALLCLKSTKNYQIFFWALKTEFCPLHLF